MKLAKITWSPSSKRSFDELVAFLELKWEKKVVVRLFFDLNFSLSLIAKNPELFPLVSEKRKLRKCVLRRKTLLLYRVKSKGHVELVIFVDARKNPKKYLM